MESLILFNTLAFFQTTPLLHLLLFVEIFFCFFIDCSQPRKLFIKDQEKYEFFFHFV